MAIRMDYTSPVCEATELSYEDGALVSISYSAPFDPEIEM